MSRKDYEAIARAIKDARPIKSNLTANIVLENVARNIADVCAQGNPRFDRARFLAACGVA